MRQPVPFGKYLLLDRISVGGMAEVFKAKSYGVEGFEKIIAIKRILPTMGEDRDFIKMFIDEAKIAGQLAHANICQIFELGRIEGSHFIAMEYIWGKDLLQIQNRLKKTKAQMPVPMACFAIAKVLEGLDYAHRKRDPLGRPLEIVHRDCSPQNVLISYEGEVKVIDFGIAKATSRNSRTMAGVLKGKFGYMSPEQVRGLPLDRRSDIFAIGTMLYECLTGERLFQGETDFSTLEKVRNVDVQAPRAVNPSIPEAIEKVILKALAKDVDDRYQWCSEMLADLQAYLMSQDVVFTAKSLSSWLKGVFTQDIERERQLLEQYKRVGRDGLIAGVPAAAANLDINENLGQGEAPAESDATQLGGPSFEEMEQGVGAAPDVNQSPAAGGARGSVQRSSAPVVAAKSAGGRDDDDGDFGEEAPTEIFGDEVGAPAAPPPAAGRAATIGPGAGRAPSKPGVRPSEPGGAAQPMAAATRSTAPGPAMPSPGLAAHAAPYASPYATPAGQPTVGSGPIASGTPSQPIGVPPGKGSVDSQEQMRTVLGVQAPVIPNYPPAGTNAYRPSAQQLDPSGHQPGAPGQPAAYGSYPQNQYTGYQPSYGSQPYGQPQYPGIHGASAPAVDQAAPVGKKSTLARDIGIGVGIAALVLVGFLVVKLVILDDGSGGSGGGNKTAEVGKLATVKLSMPASMTAEMFVDGTRVGIVANDQTVGVKAGVKHIKLVGNNGLTCDDPKVALEAGKTTLLRCGFANQGGSAAGSAAAGSAAGSAAQMAQGSAAGDTETTKPEDAAKPSDTKSSDAKSSDAKSSDAKSADAKSTKTADTKAADTKSTKTADTKSSDIRVSRDTRDTKTSDTRDTKTTKTSDVKSSDSSKGYLQVFSKTTAKILVDGVETGLKTPVSGQALPLTPGKHKITYVIGDDRFTYPIVIKGGATETMSKDL